MHIATVEQTHCSLPLLLADMHGALLEKISAWKDIVKMGRTHLQDATIDFGAGIFAYATRSSFSMDRINNSLQQLLYPLAQRQLPPWVQGLNSARLWRAFLPSVVAGCPELLCSSAKQIRALATRLMRWWNFLACSMPSCQLSTK